VAHEILDIETVHPTKGYSHAARAGNLVVAAGQVANDRDDKLVGPGDVAAQALAAAALPVRRRQVGCSLLSAAMAGGLRFVAPEALHSTDESHFAMELARAQARA